MPRQYINKFHKRMSGWPIESSREDLHERKSGLGQLQPISSRCTTQNRA